MFELELKAFVFIFTEHKRGKHKEWLTEIEDGAQGNDSHLGSLRLFLSNDIIFRLAAE